MISDKAIKTLELDKVLARLEEYASFSAGKDAASELKPVTDLRTVRERLDQTSEARELLEAHPNVHLGGAHDIRSAVRRAEIGSVLTPAELLDVAGTLGASARLRSVVLRNEPVLPWLRRRADSMLEDRSLVARLEETFSDRGEVLDSASAALRRIRLDIQSAQGRLMDRLNSMITSTQHRSALQEPIVTMRNGRYVVPVKHDSRTKVPGIVHDQSASGQTVFIEPLAVTEMNNRLKELELEEQREIERILQELSGLVAAVGPQLRATVDALGDVDLAFAKAKLAGAERATAPKLNDDGRISLTDARHPLLTGNVVPISVWLGQDFRVLVITGPNTGGKTVALKTVGLLTLMAQSGLHVPAADGSEVAMFKSVFADIGDEQSIEQSLSTFSSHMRTIVAMLPDINENSLVLLDELGAGTDPTEGAALARAILIALVESGARAVVTTHYSELKTFAHERPEAENASVEFDVRTLSPTYRLMIGLPGRSQALAIAKRLGMPQEVLDVARQSVSGGAARVEKLLGQIQAERREIGRLLGRARDMHADARKLRDRVRSELTELRGERQQVLEEARQEAGDAVRELRRRLREIEDGAKGSVSRREQKGVRSAVEEAQSVAAAALGTVEPAKVVDSPLQPVRVGATVEVLSLGQQGTVASLSGGEAEVQIGNFKMRVPADDLKVLSRAESRRERSVEYTSTRAAPPTEIDVRGMRPDEALPELDQYLHDSFMHGQGTVRIVHGKGTGALRKAIRDQLGDNPLVKSFASEDPKLGGDGVTLVKLAV